MEFEWFNGTRMMIEHMNLVWMIIDWMIIDWMIIDWMIIVWWIVEGNIGWDLKYWMIKMFHEESERVTP